MASVPEPPPKNQGVEVTPLLIKHLQTIGASSEVISLVEARRAYGLEKYGQSLMTEDGRNTYEDAHQEAGDLLQYLFKAKLQGLKDEVEEQKIVDTLMLCLKILGR